MIAIFTRHGQTLIAGLDDEGNLMDTDGIISGPDPEIDNLSEFVRFDFDPDKGMIANIATFAETVYNGATRLIK